MRARRAGPRGRGRPAGVRGPVPCTTGHCKGTVVDSSALVMSSNGSAAGLGTSIEGGLRVDDRAAADYFAEAFERDWQVSNPT